MFDEVTKQERGRRAARSTAYMAASAALQALCVLAIVLVGDRLRAAATGPAPLVAVKFIKAPASLLAAPPPPGHEGRVPPKPKPQAPRRIPPPTALIQPKEVPAQLPSPAPGQQPEPEQGHGADGIGEGAAGTEGGVIGGVPGGLAQGGGGTEDAPVYAGAGFRKPAQAVRSCVQDSIRIPRDLQGFVSGPIAAKFAIRKDGTPAYFQMVTQVPDRRIADAIRQAVMSCQWTPGTDAEGHPTSIWVILPIRFRSG